ncbi:hypothetical protein GN956_G24966 [Arapaima gigas]
MLYFLVFVACFCLGKGQTATAANTSVPQTTITAATDIPMPTDHPVFTTSPPQSQPARALMADLGLGTGAPPTRPPYVVILEVAVRSRIPLDEQSIQPSLTKMKHLFEFYLGSSPLTVGLKRIRSV